MTTAHTGGLYSTATKAREAHQVAVAARQQAQRRRGGRPVSFRPALRPVTF